MIQETIICSAIYIRDKVKHEDQPQNIETGFVVCGRRHHNCYATIKAFHPNLELFFSSIHHPEEDQGFVTSLNRYVDREEGFTIARDANQLLKPEIHDPNLRNMLTSDCIFPIDWENFKY